MRKPFSQLYTNNNIAADAHQRGFSLVEMMLYIALVSLALVSIVALTDNLRTARVKSRSIEEVQQDARFVMHRISVAMHNATDIVETSTTLNSDVGETDGVLTVATDTGTLTIAIDSGAVTFDDGAGRVALTSDKTVTTEFLIEDRTPGSGTEMTDIKVTLTVEHVNPGNAKEFEARTELETTISLRP